MYVTVQAPDVQSSQSVVITRTQSRDEIYTIFKLVL